MGCADKCGNDGAVFEGRWYQHIQIRLALMALVITAMTYTLEHFDYLPEMIGIGFYILAIVLGGWHWSREGIEELIREKEIGIEILMMAATIGSAILGMWEEAATLVILYGAAEGLEEYTFAKTRSSIRKLLDLAPKEARLLEDGHEKTVAAKDLKIGDIFLVKPGESIATDGVIRNGESSVNEAPLTGESIPVEKSPGMKVFAATINQNGALEIKVTNTYENNSISKMIQLVEEAQGQKSKTQQFIEKFGKIYSPLVLLSALLLIAIPYFLNLPLSVWAVKAVVLLVAAAPCALVMSTPVAISAGIGTAGKNGVLIKGGMHLETLGKIKAIALDKTGTLTWGKPVVTDVIAFDDDTLRLLALALAVEKNSEHPLAQAIVEKAKEKNASQFISSNFQSLTGFGAKAQVEGQTISVGKPGLFPDLEKNASILSQVEKLRHEGKTVVLVGDTRTIIGLLALRDEVRPQAKKIIEHLHHRKIKVVMLTGDNALTARAIAAIVGIDEVKSDLLPQDKVSAIAELEARFGYVAMVGDGINDAPALARASVGIAMGTAGTDAAIEAADVALMGDDLEKVDYAITLGKKAKRISAQNIIFSLTLLAIMIPLALTGAISVAWAVFFHESAELLAVANGLRIRNAK